MHTKATLGHKATRISGKFAKDYTQRLGICFERNGGQQDGYGKAGWQKYEQTAVAKGRRESWSRRRFPAAHYLPKQGKFVEAGQMCRRALEGFREVLGSNHPCRIRAANNLLPWFGVDSILSWNLLLVNHANLDLDQFKPNLRVFIVYQLKCGRDKGMPNGWSFILGKHGNEGKGEPRDTLCRKLACCLSAICVLAISNRCQKAVPLPIRD